MHSTKMDKNWCQGWSNHQNQEVLWWKRPFGAVEVAEANEVNVVAEVLRSEKWGLQSHWGSWIQLYVDVLKQKNILVESWNIMLNFSTFPIRGCRGQLMLLLWKKWFMKLKLSKPQEATRQHDSKKIIATFASFNLRHPVLENLQWFL